MGARVEFDEERVRSMLIADATNAIKVIGQELFNRVEQSISTQGPPRSAPGEPPHMDTKELHDTLYLSIDTSTLTIRVGSPLDHSVDVEYGGVHVAPRPFIRPVIAQMAAEIGPIMARYSVFKRQV